MLTGLWLREAATEMLEARAVPTSECKKDGCKGTQPCIFRQPPEGILCGCPVMSLVPSQQGLTVIKNWLSDVQCILFNEAEQTGIHFITVSVKTTKLFKSLTLKNSKLQFPRKLTFFSDNADW